MSEPNVVLQIGRWEWRGWIAVLILWGMALCPAAFVLGMFVESLLR